MTTFELTVTDQHGRLRLVERIPNIVEEDAALCAIEDYLRDNWDLESSVEEGEQ